jgi:hypothetical protein
MGIGEEVLPAEAERGWKQVADNYRIESPLANLLTATGTSRTAGSHYSARNVVVISGSHPSE